MDSRWFLVYLIGVLRLVCLSCLYSALGQGVNLIEKIHDQVNASQSSTWCRDNDCWVASRGIDSNENTIPKVCACCAGAHYIPSWWNVDLGDVYSIKKIIYIGRTDSCTFAKATSDTCERGSSFEKHGTIALETQTDVLRQDPVQSRNFFINKVTDGKLELIHWSNASSNTSFELSLNPPVALQILNITHSTEAISVCELKLIESDYCPVPYFDRHCNQTCHCFDKQPCNKTSGNCHSPGCKAGWKGASCNEACDGKSFGTDCSFDCHCNAEDRCNRFYGHCSSGICALGWMGDNCSIPCDPGTFGQICSSICHCKNNVSCNHVSGDCDTCAPGWQGKNCSIGCDLGSFGDGCSHSCHCYNNASCDRFTGICSNGLCATGYRTSSCSEKCETGSFGRNCSFECYCLDNEDCSHVSGRCDACAPGWQGETCSIACDWGIFGEGCSHYCHCYNNASCERSTGICSNGLCATGYRTSSCSKKCETGTFGQNCSFKCHCLNNEDCSHVSGKCNDCASGWQDETCSAECEPGTYGNNCSFECHCENKEACNHIDGSCDACSPGWQGTSCNTVLKEEEPTPATAVIIGPVVGVLIIAAVVVAVFLYRRHFRSDYSAGSTSLSTKAVHYNAEYENPLQIEDGEHEYQVINNVGPADAISVRQLWNQVKLMDDDGLKTAYIEFESQMSNWNATHVSDETKNDKYKRVEVKDGENVKRYISDANYINGYNIVNRYIAVKGPSNEDEALGFWEIVFQSNVSLIVMLQDAKAKRKAHTFQYWSSEGRATYGKVIVKTTKYTSSLDIDIREFEIMQNNNRKSVTQVQFTGPFVDNTPCNVHSFLLFWRQSIALAEKIADPIIVHCSDGIGVTGLYIATDILYSQVMAEKSVNPREVIGRIRRKRINTIQTKEQFRFLFEALLEALYMPVKSVEACEFESFFTPLSSQTTGGQTWMTFQYDVLFGDVSAYSDLQQEVKEHEYSSLTQKIQDARKLQKRECQPFAQLQNYANQNTFILTAVDDKRTFDLLWKTIDESQVQTVVCSDRDILNLFSSDDVLYSIYLMESAKEHGCVVNTYGYKRKHLIEANVNSVKSFYLEESLPGDVSSAASFVQTIQSCQPKSTDRHPILLAYRSNVSKLPIVYVLLHENERLRSSGQINIIHAVQHLKERSEQFVPSLEGYAFCHSVMLNLANESSVYVDIDENTNS